MHLLIITIIQKAAGGSKIGLGLINFFYKEIYLRK
jgi:hypothetical protein